MKEKKTVLDTCCGPKMFWFDNNTTNPRPPCATRHQPPAIPHARSPETSHRMAETIRKSGKQSTR